ncbi:MAG: polysaccharide export protein [Planctomycetes bacterium]|nr:polysaccharide export protein [Planctomycetota bacterium]
MTEPATGRLGFIARRASVRLPFVWLCASLPAVGCSGPGEHVNEAALRRWAEPQSVGVATIYSDVLAGLSPDHEYRVGPDDVLSITVRHLERLGERTAIEVQVDRRGEIELPLAGVITVAGLTTGEIREVVAGALDRFIAGPEVSVVVREFRSARVAVLGAVAQPGFVSMPATELSLTEALALAGGLSDTAGTQAYVLRARRTPREPARLDVDLEALERGYLSQNVVLRRGDVVRIPRAPPFYVTGFVHRVGEYPLRKPTTLLEAVAIAGGVQIPDASPTLTRIRRRTPAGETVIEVDLVAVAAGEAEDVALAPWDVVEVPQSTTRWVVLGVVGFVTRIVTFGYNLAALF